MLYDTIRQHSYKVSGDRVELVCNQRRKSIVLSKDASVDFLKQIEELGDYPDEDDVDDIILPIFNKLSKD